MRIKQDKWLTVRLADGVVCGLRPGFMMIAKVSFKVTVLLCNQLPTIEYAMTQAFSFTVFLRFLISNLVTIPQISGFGVSLWTSFLNASTKGIIFIIPDFAPFIG